MMLLSACVGWLAGSAFWYGWNQGSLREAGIGSITGDLPSTLWVMWPVFVLGRSLGQRHTARQLAPERMRQKLMQEQQFMPQSWVTTTPTVIVPFPTWPSTP